MVYIPHYIQILIIKLYLQNLIWNSIILHLTKGMYRIIKICKYCSDQKSSFNWEQALSNSSIDKKISILHETIISVMTNYIPNEIKVSDDQKPPWMNAEIENLITA